MFPDTSQPNRRRLARWLWRATIAGTHERAAVSKLRHQLRLIGAPDSHETAREPGSAGDETAGQERALLALEEAVGDPRLDWTLRKFHASSAHSRVEILALLSLEPRHRDGGRVSWRALLSSGQRVAREVFYSADRKTLPKDTQRLARTAANRVLLDETHSGLANTFKTWDQPGDHAALASHLIDEEAWDALREKDIGVFLRRRQAKLQRLVSELLTDWASLDLPLVRPIEVYYEGTGHFTRSLRQPALAGPRRTEVRLRPHSRTFP